MDGHGKRRLRNWAYRFARCKTGSNAEPTGERDEFHRKWRRPVFSHECVRLKKGTMKVSLSELATCRMGTPSVLQRLLKGSFKRLNHEFADIRFLTPPRACDIEDGDRVFGHERSESIVAAALPCMNV